ncbi:MAG: MmcQ/YjbR family DNA-binding protein [Bacteroidales bacterium]|nr:MmcQ/YjbR family DNA-binding protein [Bacteroidales bacterium]
MNVEELRDYCLSLGADVEERFPFAAFKGGQSVLVFYVEGHMFCFFDIDVFEVVSVKCQPDRIVELREAYPYLGNPYNESPRHWLGITIADCPDTHARQLIANSYQIVKEKYTPRSRRKTNP